MKRKYDVGLEFIVTIDIDNNRDGLVIKGTKAYIDEISNYEYNSSGKKTPYKVFFEKCSDSPYYEGYGNECFSLAELKKMMK